MLQYIFRCILFLIIGIVKKREKRVEKCEKMLEYIIERLDEGSSMMKRDPEEGEYIINERNVMKMRVAGPYNFSFHLLDMLFTKEELAKSLLYESKKSDKITYNTGTHALPDIYALTLGRRAYISGKALLPVL